MDRGARRATVHGITRVGHDLETTPPPPLKANLVFLSLYFLVLLDVYLGQIFAGGKQCTFTLKLKKISVELNVDLWIFKGAVKLKLVLVEMKNVSFNNEKCLSNRLLQVETPKEIST